MSMPLAQLMHLSASFAEKNSAAVETSDGSRSRSGAADTTCEA